ncbi:MAG TPA: DNA N-6-adenine-methyltransferase [Galbitalea sp.]
MSDSDSYCSPPEIADPLEQFANGPVSMDPFSNPFSLIKARRALFAGGLHLPWGGYENGDGDAFENPPYSRLTVCTDKGLHEMMSGNIHELIRLVTVSTSTEWWKRAVTFRKYNVRLLFTRRISFLLPCAGSLKKRKTANARHESVLMYYGARAGRFEKYFAHLSQWTRWGR